MTTIVLVIILSTLGLNNLASSLEEYVSGFPIQSLKFKRSVAVNPLITINFCAGVYGPTCLNCNTLLTCSNEIINSQSCSSINPSTPYCRGSACVANSDRQCDIPFRCTGSGQYPHPSDCTMYYFCMRPTNTAVAYRCPANYVYDSKSGLCKLRKTAADCQTIDCTNRSNTYLVYAADKSILVYCADTATIKETILFQCVDTDNMEYDAITLTCKFVCKSAGRFPDQLDSNKFYECFGSGSTFQYLHQSCPNNFSFDSAKGCVANA